MIGWKYGSIFHVPRSWTIQERVLPVLQWAESLYTKIIWRSQTHDAKSLERFYCQFRGFGGALLRDWQRPARRLLKFCGSCMGTNSARFAFRNRCPQFLYICAQACILPLICSVEWQRRGSVQERSLIQVHPRITFEAMWEESKVIPLVFLLRPMITCFG